MGNITFGSFIAEKRKAHKFNLRDTAKHLNIAYGYLCDIEQSRRPAPNGDFVERISAFLNLDKSEHELLLDLAAKSRNTVSADLPDYIMEKDIVRAALRVAKEVDASKISMTPFKFADYQAFLCDGMLEVDSTAFMDYMEENDLGYIVDYKRYNADVFTGVNRRTAAVFQFHSAALRRLNKVGCQRYEGDYTRLKQKHAERRARRMAG